MFEYADYFPKHNCSLHLSLVWRFDDVLDLSALVTSSSADVESGPDYYSVVQVLIRYVPNMYLSVCG
jgi:hypothetical protein